MRIINTLFYTLFYWIEQRLRWKSWAWIFAVVAATISSLLMYWNIGLLEVLDQRAKDYIVRLSPAIEPSSAVAVVAVDEKSIKTYGRWPWKRALQAQLITTLKQHYRVGVMGLDIIYLQPEDEVNDRALAAALEAPGSPIVGGYFFRSEQTFGGDAAAQAILQQNQIPLVHVLDNTSPDAVFSYDYVETNQNALTPFMAGLGFFNTEHDIDGLVRKTPLVAYYKQAYYPSLALRTLVVYCQLQLGLIVADHGVAAVRLMPQPHDENAREDVSSAVSGQRCASLWKQPPPLTVPVNRAGSLWLDFYRQAMIPIYSAADILDRRLEPALLQDKIIFVGVTEIGIADLRPTPIDASFPGVAVHATVVSNILRHQHYEEGTEVIAFLNSLLVMGLPFLIVFIMARLQRALLMIVSFIVILAGVSMIFWWAISHHWLISIVYPLLAIGITFILTQTYFILTTQKHARFLRNAFAAYVSPDLVGILVKHPENLHLHGQNRNISVLFSDIRGFTTLSESLAPETLVALLNAYLGPMTDIVMAERGTLDKYIGDAVMALYNAPIDVPDHAVRATRSALTMIHRLAQLNRQFAQDFKITLHIGIGIHSGPAIVGNMGSATRFNYTAMGDTVNLASRLEGRTKAYGVQLIVSDETQRQLGELFLCRRLDKIRVKGKHIPVTIFEVLALTVDAAPWQHELVRGFERALDTYFKGQFREALAQWEHFLQRYPEDGPGQVFRQRCEEFLTHPVPLDWDGVYTATDK